MDLAWFQVTNYRNIIDSGRVDVGDIAAFVGQNECGKSNLLEAFHRLNSFDGSKYKIAEDWPIDRWPPPEEHPVVCTAEFRLGAQEISDLFDAAAIPPEADKPPSNPPEAMSVVVSKNYNNQLLVDVGPVGQRVDAEKARLFIEKRLPKCIYMNDYRIFRGSHPNFPDLNNRYRTKQNITPEEKTLMTAVELASLDLTKVAAAEVTQRTYFTTAASGYLTRRFAKLWRQKPVRFDIRVDGNNLNVFVEDEGLGAPIPLEHRSAGFQWYVSFIWLFTRASEGEFKNCILLLDEPGVRLHHAGHADLLAFLATLAETNKVLYTTHLATMIDPGFPERIRILEVRDHHSHVVNWVVSGQRQPMMVIEARLGLSGSMSGLLGNRQNLIVEGVDDMLILQKLSGVLRKSGEESLSDRVYLLPAHGAANTPLFAAFMIGNKLDAGVLVDSDEAGDAAIQRIKNQRVPEAAKENQARFKFLRLGKIAGVGDDPFAIEDIFPPEFYVECVNEAYGSNLTVDEIGTGGLIANRCEAELVRRGRIQDKLDKRLIMSSIQKRFDGFSKSDSLPEDTAKKARNIFAAINQAFA